MGEQLDERPAAEQTYSYRPSLMGAPWVFELMPDALRWEAGRRSGRIPYRDIYRVRMLYRPVTLVSHRFVTEIWSKTSPKISVVSTSWKSMVEVERQDARYRDFIVALHDKLAAEQVEASFEAGSPPFIYWPGVLVFCVLTAGLVALAVKGMAEGALAGAAFVAAFFALFMWQIGGFFWRNRPGRYRPDALPAALMPGK